MRASLISRPRPAQASCRLGEDPGWYDELVQRGGSPLAVAVQRGLGLAADIAALGGARSYTSPRSARHHRRLKRACARNEERMSKFLLGTDSSGVGEPALTGTFSRFTIG
jgi:hypothetical protein